MPSSNLASYLAKNYLTASTSSSSHFDEPPKKKRKKSKHQTTTTGLVIADDDEDLSLSNARNGANQDDDADTPVMYEGTTRSAEFRKAKNNAWKPLSGTEQEAAAAAAAADDDPRDDEADTFLRTAQSDEARRLAEQEAENAPAVVELDGDKPSGPKMESGMRAGLQTAADTARIVAEEEAREVAERKALKKVKKKQQQQELNDENQGEQTIYRDAMGRRIDLSLRRAEARREEAEKAKAVKQEKLDAMGDVQRQEREDRRRELDEAKFLTLGRGVEDEEYNDRLKDQVRWDDPMAAYMAEKREEEEELKIKKGGGNAAAAAAVVPRKKVKEYQGASQPNRYGIKPGWRWDGVDRGNGFEKEWFQARNRRSRNDQLRYEWQMDE